MAAWLSDSGSANNLVRCNDFLNENLSLGATLKDSYQSINKNDSGCHVRENVKIEADSAATSEKESTLANSHENRWLQS